MPTLPLYAHIRRWAIWPTAMQSSAQPVPSCSFLDAGARRRLSSLAKIAFWLGYECEAHLLKPRVVFASRHGEANKVAMMLENITKNEDVSPTAFSLSVHNAVPGLFSMHTSNHASMTAIAAGEGTLGMAILHTIIEQRFHKEPVLLIYADHPLENEIYKGTDSPSFAHGISLLIDSEGEKVEFIRDQNNISEPIDVIFQGMSSFLTKKVDRTELPDKSGSWKLRYV
ncbi:MAG: beta-ketoacyl synthase chain length factor [Pseudomonadota bacterium]